MTKPCLIVDLDDTIFETNSIDLSVFRAPIELINRFALSINKPALSTHMLTDLQSVSFDLVAKKYNFPQKLEREFIQSIHSINVDLKIKPFPDYPFLKRLNCTKILVTTGFKELQNLKIKSLGIENDFEEIFIDDPTAKYRIFKKGIFASIINKYNLRPSETWVIGDNPASELQAAASMGLQCIQRLNPKFKKSNTASHYISSFEELKEILPQNF